ncbi:unnamed protein product [Arctia plantaginis]|uniref:Uncharacterized protein n=1 Tax=Arctia plantaginis TaxID=874455 RepID=A0A8S0ZHH6_ARCPL|nr:unnamed protein product [Arctia plantaginis]
MSFCPQLDLEENPVLKMLVRRPTSTIVAATDITATFTVSLLETITMWYLPSHLTIPQRVIYRPIQMPLMTSYRNLGINLVAESEIDQNFALLPSLSMQDGLASTNVSVDTTLWADKKGKEFHYNNGQDFQDSNKVVMRSQQQRETKPEHIAKPRTTLTVVDNENLESDVELINGENLIKTRGQIPLQRFHLLHTSNIPHLLWNEMNDPLKESELHHKISAPNEVVEPETHVDGSIKNIQYQSTLLKAPKAFYKKNISTLKNTLNFLMEPTITKPLQPQTQHHFVSVQKNTNYNGQIESEDDIKFSDLLPDDHKSKSPDTGLDFTRLSTKDFVVTY